MLFENAFIYHPAPYPEGDWNPAGLAFEDAYFAAEDGTELHGWMVPAARPIATVLFSHGNAGNLAGRADNVRLLVGRGLSVFIYDYRGYGRSQGSPSEAGLYRDAVAAYDHLVRFDDVDRDRVVLFGRSLGAAVTCELALRRPAAAVLLESAFTSAPDMAGRVLPIPGLRHLVGQRFASIEKVGRIEAPIFILHGNRDSIIPFEMGRRLFEAAREPKRFLEIDGADHNDTYVVGGRAYFDAIERFIGEAVGSPIGAAPVDGDDR